MMLADIVLVSIINFTKQSSIKQG